MIEYHKTHSLEEFNRELKDLKLVKPLVKKTRPPPSITHRITGVGASGGVSSGGGGGGAFNAVTEKSSVAEVENPDPQIAEHLVAVHAKWLVKQNDHEEKYEEHAEVMSRLQDNKQALEAFRQTVLIYESQAEMHKRMASELETGERLV